jgi:hypothetical protein
MSGISPADVPENFERHYSGQAAGRNHAGDQDT